MFCASSVVVGVGQSLRDQLSLRIRLANLLSCRLFGHFLRLLRAGVFLLAPVPLLTFLHRLLLRRLRRLPLLCELLWLHEVQLSRLVTILHRLDLLGVLE